jgi:hypothetical protein
MQAGKHMSGVGNVIPLFTSTTIDATSTRRFATRARSGILHEPHRQEIQTGLNNGLGSGHQPAWHWEDATLALLGSTGLGAIAIAFRVLA